MSEAAQSVDELRVRLDGVRRRVDACARRAGRDPSEVTLIAVSKTHAATLVARAIDAGARDLGENRVQEADAKIAEVEGAAERRARWHLIGHLQSNKARRAVKVIDVIHTVDSVALIERLERLCEEEGRAQLPVLAQLSLAGEATKAGAGVEELPPIVERAALCARVRLVGLMTMPPFDEDAESARPFFRRLRGLRDEWRARGAFAAGAGELSMGMSHDFEIAVEEGATMVRVGTAIFGAREKPQG
ncbi:MAG TPA: YggS family pyridoxal phosphate-dependent enzyme [Pyrinomonadaceae bacterium]|nr:YggS family pyridoxal phosphate-dependent enzyme [Pyrinomonadaceae bacterium]